MASLPTKEEALEIIGDNWYPRPRVESVEVARALGRVPARDHFSENRLPVVRSAVMDGYAVRSADFAGGPPDTVGWAEGREYVRADMGDDFDDAYDAVVLVEDVSFGNDYFQPREGLTVTAGLNVRPAGSQLDEGELLVAKGRPLLPRDLGFLQMGGLARVDVLARPRTVFIPTGSELVPPGQKPKRGQNVESNGLMVAETLRLFGAEPINFPILRDDPGALAEAFHGALAIGADIVILNGGSSKGGDDHNARLLRREAKPLLQGVAAAPGKPLGLYVSGEALIVNLPGPMVAAYHGLEWCLNFAVRKFLRQPPARRPRVEVTLTGPLETDPGLSILFNLSVTRENGRLMATPLDPRSARTHRGIGANAQYMTDVAGESLAAGDRIVAEAIREGELF
ncbi:MAG: molybdopterin molybdotransferase MoeA [Deltaproteobacteria bacterium]|jgi:molybdopterin molybdotransferase/putative molybdopterin biosynthesis protein|nr:molybdopterin molybdotransferase MoeA [Deltaproteobacteria bacterium]